MRIRKDGTERTHVGAQTFRELADIRVHKYGYGLPGKRLCKNNNMQYEIHHCTKTRHICRLRIFKLQYTFNNL